MIADDFCLYALMYDEDLMNICCKKLFVPVTSLFQKTHTMFTEIFIMYIPVNGAQSIKKSVSCSSEEMKDHSSII